jgi:hypothetical protein
MPFVLLKTNQQKQGIEDILDADVSVGHFLSILGMLLLAGHYE